MAYEERSGRQYRYRSVKKDGRVQKRYIGAGHLAAMADKLDRLTSDRKKRRVSLVQAQHDLFHVAGKLLEELDQRVNVLVDARLAAAGYVRRGGKWKQRG